MLKIALIVASFLKLVLNDHRTLSPNTPSTRRMTCKTNTGSIDLPKRPVFSQSIHGGIAEFGMETAISNSCFIQVLPNSERKVSMKDAMI